MHKPQKNNKYVIQKTHLNEGGFRAISGVPHEYTYGEHTYQKGALVAHNMRAYLGDSLFFVGLKSITDNYQFKNINASRTSFFTVNGIVGPGLQYLLSFPFTIFSYNSFN
mgnify:CR=1 FL=1